MTEFAAGQRFPESRRAPRYPIAAPAELIEPVSDQHVQGWTTVISETGCYVRAADTLPSGAVAQLRIEREGRSFASWARVVHAVPATGMGLAFFDMEQLQREILKSWIEEVTFAMRQEIEKTTELAGFTQLRADNSVQAVFRRGPITLIVRSDGNWSCYAEAGGGRRPYCDGADFKSLVRFLQYESAAATTKSLKN
jgi:hypothetical protein